jgi:glycosyltransferase involved in cell wall biosynthesis
MLKVAHLPFTYAPDPIGGTETYVEALAQNLRSHGFESVIVAPSSVDTDGAYQHHGLRVRRFCCAPTSKQILEELYGDGDPLAAAAFARIVDEERPDVVHVHAFTRAVSVLVVRSAKQRKLPVFFTYHTPTVSCVRGTMMLWGTEPCDGALDVGRCTSCSLHARGMPKTAAQLLSRQPMAVSRVLQRMNLSGGLCTALRMPELISRRHQAFRALLRDVDRIVVLSPWVGEVLVRNGTPESKIAFSRHGLPSVVPNCEPPIDAPKTPLRVAFLGRANKVKGADTLIKAIRSSPGLDIQLDLYGVAQSAADRAFWRQLQQLAGQDRRINFLSPVPHDQVISLLRAYHALAVPSRWLETGPLVILEAFAAGTPVIGSKLGGIADLVQHESNGLLVDAENIHAWVEALHRCTEDRGLLTRLKKGIESPRSMTDVARDMAQLYREQLDASHSLH